MSVFFLAPCSRIFLLHDGAQHYVGRKPHSARRQPTTIRRVLHETKPYMSRTWTRRHCWDAPGSLRGDSALTDWATKALVLPFTIRNTFWLSGFSIRTETGRAWGKALRRGRFHTTLLVHVYNSPIYRKKTTASTSLIEVVWGLGQHTINYPLMYRDRSHWHSCRHTRK